ncbi:hypothetical protein JXB41_04175 [Candidatus Woesearchaeota archaeon]|nr:hypothetical protein [Candidatus Woesearchaeota archaeon]
MGNIYDENGFIEHNLTTGDIAWNSACKLVKASPYFEAAVVPELVRTYGYLHDIGKVTLGVPLHEIETAYLILTKGEEWGLVRGGCPKDRKDALRIMANLSLSDSSIYPMIESRYSKNLRLHSFKVYSNEYQTLKSKAKTIVSELTGINEEEINDREVIIFLQSYSLPNTPMKKIALYADSVNLKGKEVDFQTRCEEALHRYNDPLSGDYSLTFTFLIDSTAHRTGQIIREIDIWKNKAH